MRRIEREQEVAKRNAAPQLALATSRVAKVNGAAAKVGAEAFVAKGKENYGQPDWESDETLEAYLSA